MVDGVSRGDTIITQGGLVGKVAKVHVDELDVDFGENARMKVVKSMIISVRGKNND
jgi:preprotein translocase subunit YajC